MDDDFNTGGAIGELFELAKITNKFCDDADLEGKGKTDAAAVAKFTSLLTTLKELANILGIFVAAPAKPQAAGGDDLLAKVMPLVIELRAAARKNKNFAVADKIRDGLGPIGITLEDRAGGTEWSGGGAERHRRRHEAPDPTPRRRPRRQRLRHRRRDPQPPHRHRHHARRPRRRHGVDESVAGTRHMPQLLQCE